MKTKQMIKQAIKCRNMLLVVALVLVSQVLSAADTWNTSNEYMSLTERIENNHSSHKRVDIGDIRMGNDKDYYLPSPFNEKHYLFYDSHNLYYTVIAEIDSSFSKGIEAVRDGDTVSDAIYLCLITQPESHIAYVYGFYPLESKTDYTIDFSFKTNLNWNSNYQYRSEIHGNLWLIEATIPFNDLRYSGNPPYNFSVMFRRIHHKSMSFFRYPCIDSRIGLEYYKSYFPIRIESRIAHAWMPKLKLHSASVYDLQHERGNKLRDNMGLNFSLKPDQNSTARITIQPDFSDTPLDSETSIYNSKYPPMIEENRGFFIEDYDLLAARSDFWYTRQIISPLAAIKYNRTENNSALAILALKDKKYDNEAASGDYWLASGYAKNIGVQQVIFNAYARTSEDLGDQNLLGYLILGIRPWRGIVINPEFCLSYDNLSDTKQIGTHGKLATAWQGEHLSFICGYEYIDKDFSARMGAVNETDQSRLMAQLGYQRYYQSILNSISAEIAVSDIYDQDFTQNQYRYLNLSMSAAGFENALSLNYNSSFSEELYSLSQYGIFSHSWDLSLSKYRYMVPSLNLAYGKSIIYSQNRTANYLSITPRIWLEVNQNTNLGLGTYYIKYYMPQTDNFDNEYFLFNLNLQTRFVDKISITQGIRLNDYTNTIVPASEESPAMLKNGYIGYYVNLDWKLNKNIGIIAGYKSKESRYRMGDLRKLAVDDQNVYLKMEYQF